MDLRMSVVNSFNSPGGGNKVDRNKTHHCICLFFLNIICFYFYIDNQVLLLSLVAGGVGLNLVGANHLIFIEPHWNPQLEIQAQDRVYRLKQTKDVVIYKYVLSTIQ